jgi:hypothetical protein
VSTQAQPKSATKTPALTKSAEPIKAAAVNNNAQQKNSTPFSPPLPRGPAPPSAGKGGQNGGPKKEFAIALYDNEVDDEEELAFVVGQRIEVIEKDDSGWYKGRLNGKEGLFPVNYVKLEA